MINQFFYVSLYMDKLIKDMTAAELVEAIKKYNEKALYYLTFEILISEFTEPEPPFEDSYIKLFAVSPDNNMIHVQELDGDNIRSFDMCHFFTNETPVVQTLGLILTQLQHKLFTIDKNIYKDLFIDGGCKACDA